MMKHKCDTMPDYVELEARHGDWVLWHDGTTVGAKFCPYCGKQLDQENYAKKSAALVLSAHLHISELGAEDIVNMLIEAVKHELK